MLDLNHGSGCQYEGPSRPPGVGAAINAAIDAALSDAQPRAAAAPLCQHVRTRPRVPAADPVRLSRGPKGRGPRVRAEDAAHLRGRPSRRGHRGGVAARRRLRPAHAPPGWPAVRLLGARWPLPRSHRRLPRRRARPDGISGAVGEQGARRRHPGRRWSRRASCWRGRSTRRRSRSIRPTSICRTRHCSRRSIATRSSCTANSCRSMPRSRSSASDRAVHDRARERSAGAAAARRRPTGARRVCRGGWTRRRMARRLCLAGPLLEARA